MIDPMARKKISETIIDIDKEEKLRREMLKMETEVNRVTRFINVKEASDAMKHNFKNTLKDSSVGKEVIPKNSNPIASTAYFWTKRSAHYKALLMARRANNETRRNQRQFSINKLMSDDDKWKFEADSYYASAEYEKENRETCREFCYITIGSLTLSFCISFLFFYFFKDYDGLLTGILFL